MKKIGSAISAVVLFGSLTAGVALAQEDQPMGNEPPAKLGSADYCHQKLPAIRPSTLASDEPEAKSTNTGDVVDYYGPCDQTPTSQDRVQAQKREESYRFDSDTDAGGGD